jgi:streptomycin 6-kinase
LLVRGASGEPAVLKVPLPHREAEHESEALCVWDGDGAVRLLDVDESGAMLLERADPGTPLGRLGDTSQAARIGGEIVRRLHRPVPEDHPFELMTDVCAEWAAQARERVRTIGDARDVALVDEGAELLESLPRDDVQHVLVHGDFHHWNVLEAQREPWLVVDAKPMVGDPSFDAAQFLGNHHGIFGPDAYAEGVEVFADAAGIDPQRALAWVFAKTAEDAMWVLSTGRSELAAGTLDYARFVKELMR